MSQDDRTFTDRDLSGARFVRCDLSGAVLRSVHIDGAEIEAPWLLEGGSLVVNGVDVAPLVDAELDRRFPGRALRHADEPDALREAWAAVERAWEDAVQRASGMPAGTVDRSVGGEFSFSQTLRHLVMAIDTWLGRAVLEREEPYHPLGQPHHEYATDGYDLSVFVDGTPAYHEVVDVWRGRQAMVRDLLAGATPQLLAEKRRNPWGPEHEETVASCLGTILEEEWEHLRYAVRDLDAIAAEG